MRNHRKIKALRNKFGSVVGYAFWAMFIEYLTELDGHVMEYSDFECELFAAELGVTVAEIKEMIEFCLKIELLFLKDGFIQSHSLDEKLLPVYEKRRKNKDLSATQKRRKDGKFSSKSAELGVTVAETTDDSDNSESESPQSKVKQSKVNKSKLYTAHLFFENDKFTESWNAFLEMRKKMKKNPTEHAKDMIINKLTELSNSNVEKACEILDQSTMNGWQGIFPIRNEIFSSNGHHKNLNGAGAEMKNNEKIEKINYQEDNK